VTCSQGLTHKSWLTIQVCLKLVRLLVSVHVLLHIRVPLNVLWGAS